MTTKDPRLLAHRSALITGLSGPTLLDGERRFLAAARPLGIILFARNCVTLDQIRRLVAEARAAIGDDDALVLIDQEGGRVQRLRPPLGRTLPAAAAFRSIYQDDPALAVAAAHIIARLLAEDLTALGIDTNCAPVLDRPVPGAHDIIGDRAYGVDTDTIVDLAGAVAGGLMAGAVLPVIKHIPGHGRATADSHLALPTVDADPAELAATDFEPFRRLRDLPGAMSAHVVFASIDPTAPASISPRVTADVIRGAIGFDGLLMSDDLGMKALSGPMRSRAEAVIRAGSDVALHCSGDLVEMEAAAAGVPGLGGKALQRFAGAVGVTRRAAADYDRAAAAAALAGVLTGAPHAVLASIVGGQASDETMSQRTTKPGATESV
ncbi:MAG: beta-N-acetylhexosaminidase [Hyphomicrobiaceae bacterium]|nr:beta-N-acetylhexosaminidase [Hyphomicrobiaceae bacterium]